MKENIYGIRRYWFSCSLFVRQWPNPVQKLNPNRGLETMICKNHFVSRNELIITHHASKRTVYSKFKITIDFNYILSRKAVRIAKTAALKFGEFLVLFFFCCCCSVRREARAPLGQSCKNFLFFFFFFYSSYSGTWSLRPQDLKILPKFVRLSLAPLRHQITAIYNFGILNAWQSRIRFVTQAKTLYVYSK